jgi:hypothetical protein
MAQITKTDKDIATELIQDLIGIVPPTGDPSILKELLVAIDVKDPPKTSEEILICMAQAVKFIYSKWKHMVSGQMHCRICSDIMEIRNKVHYPPAVCGSDKCMYWKYKKEE